MTTKIEPRRTIDRNDWAGLLTEIDGLALIDLAKWSEQWSATDIGEIGRFLCGVVVHLTRKSAYFEMQEHYTQSNRAHKEGVKFQNARASKVRKAIGYTYAKDDINF